MRILATRSACLLVLIALAGLAALVWRSGEAGPFVWRDVALVHLACAAPLAFGMALALRRRLPGPVMPVLAALALVWAALIFPGDVRFEHGHAAAALRSVLAQSAMLAAALALEGLRAGAPPESKRWAAAALAVAILAALPYLYVQARLRHDLAALGGLLEQSRVVEAHALAKKMLALDGNIVWRDEPLAETARALDRQIRDYEFWEMLLARPRAETDPSDDRLQLARVRAMLGRTGEALATLDALESPDAHNLRGAIHEARQEWDAGESAYADAKSAWLTRADSPERGAGLARAVKGIAYCQRKAGRYADAEAAYQELLSLAPTADTHFLLAQFYEDAQQAEKARTHARHAMARAPRRYQEAGEKLIRKLSVHQFGCLRVFIAEGSSP